MPPKKQQSKAAGKRKRQQDSPEPGYQSQAQDVVNGEPHSLDEATMQRLRQAYPFLTHTRQAFVEGSSAHHAATQNSFPTRDELAKWKSEGGNPATYPATLGNLAEWMTEMATMRPPPRPNTQRARAIARARAEQAEEAEAQQTDSYTETTGSADEAISQGNPEGALRSRAKRSSRGANSTFDADAEEEGVELTPRLGKKVRQMRPKAAVSGARKTVKGGSPSPMTEAKEAKSKTTPTLWIVLKLRPPKPHMPQIPGLSYEFKPEVASESIRNFEGDPAYDSEETTDDPDLAEMKDASSILMSMAADEAAGRQIEEANMTMFVATDQEADRQVGATREYEAAESMLMLSKSTGHSHDTIQGFEHSDNIDELLTAAETDGQQDPGDQFASAPVRMTFDLAHAPSRTASCSPEQQNKSLLGPLGVNERGRAAQPKKRKHEEIEET